MATIIRSTSFNVVQNVHAPVPPRKNINIVRISHLNPRNSGFTSLGLTNRSIRANCEGFNGGASVGESLCIGSEKGEGFNGGASVGESPCIGSEKGEGFNGGASAGESPCIGFEKGVGVNGGAIGSEKGKVVDKKGKVVDKKGKVNSDLPNCMLGKLVKECAYYRQAFPIRSYDTGPDQKLTMEGVMNLLQEITLNYTSLELGGNEFGATRAMIDEKLIWVVTSVHVEVYKYSSRGDVVEIDTWVDKVGSYAMRRDWIIRDYKTQETIARATSEWFTMNRETRKTRRIPNAVMEEFKPLFYKNPHAPKITAPNVPDLKTAENIKPDLSPRWTDIDANQHVNNVKYIGLILESVPKNVLQDYNMTSITLRYKKECKLGDVFESGTTMKETNPPPTSTATSTTTITADSDELGVAPEGKHVLRLQDDDKELVLATTKWLRKSS